MTSSSREVMLPPYSALIDTPSGALRPVLEPSTQGHGVVQARPEEGHKDDQRAGAPLLERNVEGTGIVCVGEEKALEIAHDSLPRLEGSA